MNDATRRELLIASDRCEEEGFPAAAAVLRREAEAPPSPGPGLQVPDQLRAWALRIEAFGADPLVVGAVIRCADDLRRRFLGRSGGRRPRSWMP